jgi:hypothetical protein
VRKIITKAIESVAVLAFGGIVTAGIPCVLHVLGASPVGIGLATVFVGAFVLFGMCGPVLADIFDGK